MIRWNAFPFLRFLGAFVSGIFFYIIKKPPFDLSAILLAFIVIYLAIFFITKKYSSTYAFKPILGITGLGILFLFGFQISRNQDDLQKQNYIGKYLKEINYYTASVLNEPEKKEKFYKVLVEVNEIRVGAKWQNSTGKVILYVKKKYSSPPNCGDHLLIKGKPQSIPGPGNPDEFDYRNYLSFQNINHQHFISSDNYFKTGNETSNHIKEYSAKLRNSCDLIFKKNLTTDAYNIASALLLGTRNSLDENIKNAYSNTGTMHILAVSGLHVAIIFQILMLLFGKIKHIKYGNIILPTLLLLCLWFYAFMTGLSPSVLRAVTMFSFIIVAKALNRNSNIYNTLALSAIFLLCIDPFYIVDVGFQLSYFAVTGIVYLHPKIYNLISPSNYVIDKIWEMTSISISAQLATFPICLYYFHQFPVYFLIANFLTIPVSFLILYIALALLVFSWVPLFVTPLVCCIEKLIWFMNTSVLILEKLPFALINGINVNILETILIYSIIIYILVFLYFKKLKYLFGTLLLVISFSIIGIFKTLSNNNISQLIIYKVKGHTAIGFLKGHKAELFVDSNLFKQPSKIKFHTYGHLVKMGMENIKISTLENNDSEIAHHHLKDALLLIWQNKTILVTGKNFNIENYKNLTPDFLIVRNHFKFSKAENKISCRNLIIDSSNHLNYSLIESKRYDVKKGAVIFNL